jgi:hypothetical protein
MSVDSPSPSPQIPSTVPARASIRATVSQERYLENRATWDSQIAGLRLPDRVAVNRLVEECVILRYAELTNSNPSGSQLSSQFISPPLLQRLYSSSSESVRRSIFQNFNERVEVEAQYEAEGTSLLSAPHESVPCQISTNPRTLQSPSIRSPQSDTGQILRHRSLSSEFPELTFGPRAAPATFINPDGSDFSFLN